jgi:hypothetical protein
MSGVSAVGDGGGEDEAPGVIMGEECYYQIQKRLLLRVLRDFA